MKSISEVWGVAQVQPDGTYRQIDLGTLYQLDHDGAEGVRRIAADEHPDSEFVLTRSEVLPAHVWIDGNDCLHGHIKAAILAVYDQLAADNIVGDPADFCHLFATAALEAIRTEHTTHA